MADQRPPKSTGDEREVLLTLLQFQRESMVRKLDGVSETDARRRIVGTDTTLLWLVKHLTMAETRWVLARFTGDHIVEPGDAVGPDDTVASAVTAYEAAWSAVDAVVTRSSLDDIASTSGDDTPVNLRWIMAHLLEETARHAGHADIIREVIDGSTGR